MGVPDRAQERDLSMTMATTDDGFVSDPASPLSLRLLLIVAALAELVDSASSLPLLFMDHSTIPAPGIGGVITLIAIALKPPLAIAAIGGALIKRMRFAVCALAAIGVCSWLFYLPSMKLSDLAVPFNWAGALFLADTQLVLPIALAAIVLALVTARKNLAILLACLPTAIRVAGLIAFVVAGGIHGI
jgi:hypothetical protein